MTPTHDPSKCPMPTSMGGLWDFPPISRKHVTLLEAKEVFFWARLWILALWFGSLLFVLLSNESFMTVAHFLGQRTLVMGQTLEQTPLPQACIIWSTLLPWVGKELWAQRIFATLSQALGTKNIQVTFDLVFDEGTPAFMKDACGVTYQNKGESNNDVGRIPNAPPPSHWQSYVVRAPNGEPKVGKDTIDDWHIELGHNLMGVATWRVRTFVHSYRNCFAFILKDLEVYNGKPIQIHI